MKKYLSFIIILFVGFVAGYCTRPQTDVIIKTKFKNLYTVPASINLAGVDMELMEMSRQNPEFVPQLQLKKHLDITSVDSLFDLDYNVDFDISSKEILEEIFIDIFDCYRDFYLLY